MKKQIFLNQVEQFADILKSKYMLVCGGSFASLPIWRYFETDTTPHVVFRGFRPNPLYEDVAEGVKLFRESGCRAIVAAGGGSAMDVAKCIKLFSSMDPSVNYLKQSASDIDVLLAAIPTTAGTGSESTRHAVIYYNGEKQSISHPEILPDVVLLDPAVLENLPVYQKKCTMLDALCQGIESWWSVNSNEESTEYARSAVNMIRENWNSYIFHSDPAAAERIMEAANLAGRAINITATTAPHAMSYKLTSMYRLPHGHAVALCLPQVWEYMLSHTERCIDPRGEEHLRRVLGDIGSSISLPQFSEMMREMEMQSPSSADYEKDLDRLASSVNQTRLKNNPVRLEAQVLREMYGRIVKEQPAE